MLHIAARRARFQAHLANRYVADSHGMVDDRRNPATTSSRISRRDGIQNHREAVDISGHYGKTAGINVYNGPERLSATNWQKHVTRTVRVAPTTRMKNQQARSIRILIRIISTTDQDSDKDLVPNDPSLPRYG
jgi:hypothetical protein